MTAARALKVLDPNAPNPPGIEAAFQAVPDTMIAEILDGELHTMPRPTRLHTRTASALGGELYAPFWRGNGGPGGWEIPFAPEIHLGPKPDKVVPDLAGWRRERLSDEVAPGGASRYYDVAPDWVCEVLWSGTKGVDRGKKMRIYRREGVRHVWLIDPIEKFLEVFQLEEMGYFQLDIYDEENAVVRAEPFDAIEIPLGALWGGQAAIS